jgi:hypothetical protein
LLAAAAAQVPPFEPTPLPASADKELSIRCLIQSNLLAANEEETAENRQIGQAGTLYWLGRVSAEFPDVGVVKLIPQAVARLKTENLDKEGEYCGSELAGRTADMGRASGILQRMLQAAEAQGKPK